MRASSLTVAVAQPMCVAGDIAANAAAHGGCVRSADARLVVFPELSLCGYELGTAPISVDDDALAAIVDACAASRSTALVGAAVAVSGASAIATLAVTGKGVTVAYCKSFLGGDEPQFFRQGDGPGCVEVDGWRVGVGICKDTRIGAHIEATLGLGIDLYAAGLVHRPDELRDQDERAARIVERGRIPVAFASAAGDVGARYPATAGHSTIWAANGTVLARATAEAGDVARACLKP